MEEYGLEYFPETGRLLAGHVIVFTNGTAPVYAMFLVNNPMCSEKTSDPLAC